MYATLQDMQSRFGVDLLYVAVIPGTAQLDEAVITQALADADRLYLTRVGLSPQGDAWFPEFDQAQWTRVSNEPHAAEEGKPGFSFEVWERV